MRIMTWELSPVGDARWCYRAELANKRDRGIMPLPLLFFVPLKREYPIFTVKCLLLGILKSEVYRAKSGNFRKEPLPLLPKAQSTV